MGLLQLRLATPSVHNAKLGVIFMPEVSRFFGISIRLCYNEHDPAHFHAVFGELEAFIEIETLSILRGQLPRLAIALVLEWAALHRAELCADWDKARLGEIQSAFDPSD